MNSKPERKRYVVLDSWRGLCACLVVFYHFLVYSHIYGIWLIRGGSMFVDFFFVLSGFVITENYRDRLLRGFSMQKFILLRLGRIYPLHLFMLALMVLHEGTRGALFRGKIPFSDAEHSLKTFIANIFLTHSLIFQKPSWNGPSWSISVEFYTYILFAVSVLLFRRKVFLAEVSGVIVVMFLASTGAVHFEWALLRCIFGFSAGALCYRLHELYFSKKTYGPRLMTIVEVGVVAAGVLFVSLFQGGKTAFFAPLVFSALIIVFAQEKGALSRLLKKNVFVLLGTLSYSIYMTHALIQTCFYNAIDLAGYILKETTSTEISGQRVWATQYWQGDILFLLMFPMVIAASYLTHRWIEKPANSWARKVVNHDLAQSVQESVA